MTLQKRCSGCSSPIRGPLPISPQFEFSKNFTRIKLWLPLLLAIMPVALSQPANDLDALKQLSLEQLSRIEVTSVSKDPVAAFRTPAAISILTSEQIHRSGARTLPDLLRLIPGISVAQINSSEWAVGIRGFQGELSKAVLVLIDGRSVYTPLFAGVFWDMQDVLLNDIDRIEVIRGPGGTIWGSNAVNGVINIITKSARDTRGMHVAARAGNVEQGSLTWRYGGGSDALSYRIFGKGFTRGPERHADDRNFDDWRRGQLGFRVDARLRNSDELTLQGDLYAGEAGQALQVSTFTPPALSTRLGYKYIAGSNLLGAWRRTLSSGGDLQVRAYYDRTERQELNFREVRHTFDADFMHYLPLERHDIRWGLGVRSSPSTFSQLAETVQFFPAKQTYNIFSGFFQDSIAVVPDKLALTLGSKFEYTTYSGFNYQPDVRLSWTPNSQHTVWGAVTRAVRTASRIEEGFNFSALAQPALPLYIRLIGDGQFQPEKMLGYELGYRTYISKRGFIGFTLFHNRYDGLLSVESSALIAESTPGAPTRLILPLRLRNGIDATTTGGELNGMWDVASWWRLRGSYSLMKLDAKRTQFSNDASTVRQLEGDTPSNGSVILSSFQLPKRVDLGLTYRYAGKVQNQGVAAYSTGDARIGWRIRAPWEIEAVGRNLLQPSHIEYGGNPGGMVGIRRSFYVGLIWRH
jgi:iron complex outermembrane receptor protein